MDLKFCFVSSDYLLLFNSVVFFSFNLVERLAKNEFISLQEAQNKSGWQRWSKKLKEGEHVQRIKEKREHQRGSKETRVIIEGVDVGVSER